MSENHLKNLPRLPAPAQAEHAEEWRLEGVAINGPPNSSRWAGFIGQAAWVLIGLGLVLALAFGLFAPGWVVGSLWGSGLVLVNLLALKKALRRLACKAEGPVSLPPYLAGFAVAFTLTVLASLAVVGGRLGHPLAFLIGLLLLWPALIIALLGQLIRKSALYGGETAGVVNFKAEQSHKKR